MDRLDELSALIAIIETGSLASAALRLNRSPPVITRTLALLERRVGGTLITRGRGGATATARGQALADDARAMLATYADATGRGASNRDVRRVRVTAPVQFGRRHVAPIIARLLAEEPGLQCELLLQDRTLDLVDERIDVAIRIGASGPSGAFRTQVGWLERIVVAAPAYLEARGEPQSPADLAQHDVILSLRGGELSAWTFSGIRREALPRLSCRFAVDDVETLVTAVCAGQGLGRLLSYQAFDELRAGSLRRLLRTFEPTPVPVQVLTRAPARSDRLLGAVLDRLVSGLRGSPVVLTTAPARQRA